MSSVDLVRDGVVGRDQLDAVGGCCPGELVAVMVLPTNLVACRFELPPEIRCVTHPSELEAMGVDTCLVCDAPHLAERYGSALGAFAAIVGLLPSDASAGIGQRASAEARAS